MIVKVQMLAFAEPGTIREVEIPYSLLGQMIHERKFTDLGKVLDLVFKFGQNDFQPKKCPSVSMGDVIEFADALYVVCATGFHKFTDAEYQTYLATPRRDRSFLCYDFKADA